MSPFQAVGTVFLGTPEDRFLATSKAHIAKTSIFSTIQKAATLPSPQGLYLIPEGKEGGTFLRYSLSAIGVMAAPYISYSFVFWKLFLFLTTQCLVTSTSR